MCLVLCFLLTQVETPDLELTAYCQRGTTATGTRAGPGTLAVDPRYIPLGSRVWIPGYGWQVARDTGRNIKRWRGDLWLPSRKQCRRFGRRKKKVLVIRARAPVKRK